MKPSALIPSSLHRRQLLLLSVGSVVPLVVALAVQYIGGAHPCELCLLQRYPYVVATALLLVAVACRTHAQAIRRVMWLAVLVWVVSGLLAAYHVGVEQGWWASATGCTAQGAVGASLDDVRAAILDSPMVSCADAAVRWLGISMAGWNMVASVALVLVGLRLVREARA